jgi:hypothetical protein
VKSGRPTVKMGERALKHEVQLQNDRAVFTFPEDVTIEAEQKLSFEI